MTAASGILHDEFHSQDFTEQGGTLEMVQLWVNLPASDKMSAPKYQALQDSNIPSVELPNSAGKVRVIAGEYAGETGPAETFTPMDVWDVRLNAGGTADFQFEAGRTLMLVVLHGNVVVNGDESAREAQLVMLDRNNSDVTIDAQTDSTLLVLSGEPIDEPIAGYGPFVMNTEAEIREAINDFNRGQFGRLETAPSVASEPATA